MNQRRGVIFVVGQAIGLAVSGALARYLQVEGISASQVLALQVLFALLFLSPWFWTCKVWKASSGWSLPFWVRAVASFIAVAGFFIAVKKVSVTTAILLFNTGPLFVPFILWLWNKKPVSRKKLLFTLIGFTGIFLILDPKFVTLTSYHFIALLAGLGAGVVMVSTRKVVKLKQLELSVLSVLVLLLVVFLPLALSQWQSLSLPLWKAVLVIGGIWAFVQYAFIGFAYGKVANLAPLLFLSVVFSAAIDWFWFHQVISWSTLWGALLVVVGSFLIVRDV